jgi:hypothetical protein
VLSPLPVVTDIPQLMALDNRIALANRLAVLLRGIRVRVLWLPLYIDQTDAAQILDLLSADHDIAFIVHAGEGQGSRETE